MTTTTDKASRLWRAALFGALLLAALAPGLASAEDDDDDWGDDEAGSAPVVEIHGFAESLATGRLLSDPTTPHAMLAAEARMRLELAHRGEMASVSFKGDFVGDGIDKAVTIDIRQAMVTFSPWSWLDVRAGRQVLTWGTGDMLFLNDLFPKDWVSFLIGRRDEYLKAPSNSLKVSLYAKLFNLDVVWTPIFEPDRFITGERLSFFFPFAGTRVGGAELVDPVEPDDELKNSEWAARLYRRLGSYEVALYGYVGFTKQPLAVTPEGQPAFSRLAAWGGSLRGPLLGGLFNLEGALHYSLDDRDGADPMVPNSQVRGLVGYERELIPNLTGAAQYYLEHILQHDELIARSPFYWLEPDEWRHVVTLRLTYRLLRDDLTLSMFAFVSPSDEDAYLRPVVSYKITDAVEAALGANIAFGSTSNTFFAQLERNTNIYGRLRYTF